MIKVIRYTSDRKEEWDDFVGKSDIPVFMFYRDYMEYHKDRFEDYSLLVYQKRKIAAVFPAHIIGNELRSHFGLTFGGLIPAVNKSYEFIKEAYNSINKFLLSYKINTIRVKLTPSIYSKTQNQTQEYLYRRSFNNYSDLKLSTCIFTKHHTFPKSSIEKRKLKLNQFKIGFSDRLEEYWSILETNLQKFHKTKPVHSLDEISFLKKRFPKGIFLYTVENKTTNKIDAGAILYVFNHIVKLQYLAASEDGRKNRASHALYYSFINEYKDSVDYVDLGNCMDDINIINTKLLYLKERFGATSYPMIDYNYDTSYQFQ
ncbi:hypothetical protein [Saccharicrinis aurantiacus]|uniref:hypothetical protein n=1 Tax=Saccharicrinis aurantiacus TaxID=1849719 RepID=UPI0008390474|nr:hypothetical protein [Saccharicrinis aurantiacus]